MLNGTSSELSRFDFASFRVPEPAMTFLSSLPPQIVPFPARQLGNLGLPKVLGRSGSGYNPWPRMMLKPRLGILGAAIFVCS